MDEQVTPTSTTPESVTAGANGSESFSHVDPSTLAPELQGVYKSLLGDYTRKTQSIAEERKRLMAERQEFEAMQRSATPALIHQTPVSQGLSQGPVDEETAQLRSIIAEEARRHALEATMPLRKERAEREMAELKEKYGELFTSNVSKMTQVILQSANAQGQPTLSLRQAFLAVVGDQLESQGVEKGKSLAYEELKVKKPTGVKPGPSPQDAIQPGKKLSFAEARARATAGLS